MLGLFFGRDEGEKFRKENKEVEDDAEGGIHGIYSGYAQLGSDKNVIKDHYRSLYLVW